MSWYVFALVDARPSGSSGTGLSGALVLRAIPGGWAVVERRGDVPPVEFGSLKRHHQVVSQFAARVPAILPVRFGTLLETSELADALRDREEEIGDAFALVRDRVQFTWRRPSASIKGGRPKTQNGRRKTENGDEKILTGRFQSAGSGAEYLRRAARAANPPPPASLASLRSTVMPLVVAERYQPATSSVPDTLYHLVDKTVVARYAVLADGLKPGHLRLTRTGPWPPFAFAPEIL
jgi:hypothetical protein